MAQDTVRHLVSSLDIDLLDPPILAGLKFDAVVPTDFATPGLAITDASAPKRIFVRNGTYNDTATGTAIGNISVVPSQADGFVLVGESKSGVIWRHDSLTINTAGSSAVYVIRDIQMGAGGTDNSKISCINASRGTLLIDIIFDIISGVSAITFDTSSVGYRVERISVGASEPSTLLSMNGFSGVVQDCEWTGTVDPLIPAFIVQGSRHLFTNCRVNDAVVSNKYGLRIEGTGHTVAFNSFRISTEAHMIRTETSLDDAVIIGNKFYTENDEAAPAIEAHACIFLDAPTTGIIITDNIAEAGTDGIFGNFILLKQVLHERLTVSKNIFGDATAAFTAGGVFIRRATAPSDHAWDSWNISDNTAAAPTLILFASGGAVFTYSNWNINNNLNTGTININAGNGTIQKLRISNNTGQGVVLDGETLTDISIINNTLITTVKGIDIVINGTVANTSARLNIFGNRIESSADDACRIIVGNGKTLQYVSISNNSFLSAGSADCLITDDPANTLATVVSEVLFSNNRLSGAASGLTVSLDKHASDAWSRVNVLGNVSVTKATGTAVNSGLSIGTLTGIVDQNIAPVGTAHTSGAGWTAGTNFNV